MRSGPALLQGLFPLQVPDGVLRGDEALPQDVGQLVVRSPLGLRHPVHRAERRPELALAHRKLPYFVPRP